MLRKRIFLDPSQKNLFRKMLKWKELPKIPRQVTSVYYTHNPVYFATLIDDEEKKGIRLYNVEVVNLFGNCFLKSSTVGVVYFYKEKKKLWTINHRHVLNIIQDSKRLKKILGLEWMENVPYFVFTKPIIKAIIKGDITNRNEAVKRYYSSIGVKGMNYKLYNLFKTNFSDRHYENYYRVATNLDNLVRFKHSENLYDMNIVRDLVEMAKVLDRKVNFNWSPKRMEAEHNKLVKEIALIRLEYIGEREADYSDIDIPESKIVKVLTSNKELVEESCRLSHCVGTSDSYFIGMLKYKTVILRYEKENTLGTAEIAINEKEYRIAQFRGKFNRLMPSEDKELLSDILKTPKFKKFLKQIREKQNNIEPCKEYKEEIYAEIYEGDLPF